MVVGDSFSGPGDDRCMNLAGVLVFNVGSHEDVPLGIYSLEIKGPRGTLKLLSIFLDLLNEERLKMK